MDLAFLLGPEGTRGKPSKPSIKEGQAVFAYNTLTAARPGWPTGKDIRIYVDTKAGDSTVARLPVNSYYADYSGQTARVTADNKNSSFGYVLAVTGDNTTPFYDTGIQVSTEAGVLKARKLYAVDEFKIADKFYANNSGDGYFAHSLGIGGVNTNYNLYVNGTSAFTGNISATTMTMTGDVRYKTQNYTSTPLKVLDEGHNHGHTLLISGDGTTYIGSGEAATNLNNLLQIKDQERLYLVSDQAIYFYTNCSDMSAKKTATLDTNLCFRPETDMTGSIGVCTHRWKEGCFHTLYTSNWFRSTGNTGWYNETYNGGIYMDDTIWIKIFNDKSFHAGSGVIRTDNSLQVGESGVNFYAKRSGDGYFQSSLGIGNTNTLYRLYVDGDSAVNGRLAILHGRYVSNQNSRYQNSAIEIRENDCVGNTKADIGYAPSIGFHWANTAGGFLCLDSKSIFNFKTIDQNRATVDANLRGNADSATRLQTSRTINGTSFNGTANIVTSYWGTSRNFTIGKTTKSVNGSANMSWSTEEITAMSDIITIERTLALTTSWQNVFSGKDVASLLTKTGTYIIQIYVNDSANINGLNHYQEYYSGIMSWTTSSTNSADADEIILHKAGQASNGHNIFLRTARIIGGNLTLQISADISDSTSASKSNLVFKFRRII